MSSPFAFLNKVTKRADKAAQKYAAQMESSGVMTYKEAFDQMFEQECKSALREIRLMKRMKDVIQDEFAELLEIKQTPSKQAYMITIRPDDTKADFFEFKELVEQFVSRKCFIEYQYSFEQKGTEPMNLGKGFHVHIVANMKQRSKSEVLRDTLSSWKSWIDQGLIAANCIDVITTKNGEALVNDYLLEYKSDDGHKAVTQSYDELWRSGMSLQRLYKSE